MKKSNKALLAVTISAVMLACSGCGGDRVSEDTGTSEAELAAVSETDKESVSDITTEAKTAGTTAGRGTTEVVTTEKSSSETVTDSSMEAQTTTGTTTEQRTERSASSTTETVNTTSTKTTEAPTTRQTEAPSTEPGTTATTAAATEATTTAHVHNWVASTQQINHPEEGHYEKVCVAEEYSYPVYTYHTACQNCGYDYVINGFDPASHVCPDGKTGYSYSAWLKVIDHYEVEPAIYDNLWIIDKEAWTETVTTYTCSECGATK